MSGNIQLSSDRGVNPRVGLCPKCGKENGEVLLLGTQDYIWKCSRCSVESLHGSYTSKNCPVCEQNGLERVRRLGKSEMVVGRSLCKACEEEKAEHWKVVSEGGVYFKCKDCRATGVIKASNFAKAVRESAGIAAPKPVGVEFTKDDCPSCSSQEVKP